MIKSSRLFSTLTTGFLFIFFLSSTLSYADQVWLTLEDNVGNGWNGATWSIVNSAGTTTNTGTLAGSFSYFSVNLVPGCYTFVVTSGSAPQDIWWTLSGAVNQLGLDGGAPASQMFSVGYGSCVPTPQPGQAVLEMFDSYGDGWNGITYTITNNNTNQVVATGTLTAGSYDVDILTIGEGCFTMQVTYGSFGEEVSWKLYFDDDIWPELEGGDGYTSIFCDYIGTPGCTDPLACNFDPAATIDDGQCCYENCVHVEIGQGTGFSGATFTLYSDDPASVLTGNLPFDDVVCLPDGCFYSLYMYDFFGQGWNGSTYTFSDAVTGEIWSTGHMTSGLSDTDQISIGNVIGCTDIYASNYNPDAACENGKCCYGTEIRIAEGDYGGNGWTGNHYTIFTIDDVFVAQGTLENGDFGEDIECLVNGCYKTTVTGGGTGLNQAYFSVYLGETLLLQNVTYSGGWVNFCIDEGEAGCMNQSSCNFDEEAVVDNEGCCQDNCVNVYTYTAQQNNNTYWEIVDENNEVATSAKEPTDHSVCLENGCYSFRFIPGHFIGTTSIVIVHNTTGDTLVDVVTGYQNQGPFSFCVYENTGCTDPEACNYDVEASNDDGSCCYGECAQLLLVDLGNDSWEGASMIISGPGENIFEGGMEAGDSLWIDICLPDGCYGVQGYGTWDGESYWQVQIDGQQVAAGIPGLNNAIPFNIGTPVMGCTDPQALNFDPLASCDDCACDYVCKADFNHDEEVNVTDFLLFIGHYDCEINCCAWDLTGEGSFDVGDLLIFTSMYGGCY